MSCSLDSFLEGHLKICQSRAGYRFSVDALILAYHAVPNKPAEKILDIGTGCGIMPLITAFRYPDVHIVGVEIQSELAALARTNVEENGFQSQIRILEGDILHLRAGDVGAPLDMVMTNPPYRKPRSGRINPQSQRALARHEITVSLDGLIKAMRRVLRTGGRGWIIYPVERLVELMACLRAHHLEPKYMRVLHSRYGTDGKRCLIKAVKAARPGLIVGPPMVIYNEDGRYTEEMVAMLHP